MDYCTVLARNAISRPTHNIHNFIAKLGHIFVDTEAITFCTVEVHDLPIKAWFLHLILQIL